MDIRVERPENIATNEAAMGEVRRLGNYGRLIKTATLRMPNKCR